MLMWARIEDTPATSFIIPKKKEADYKLVGFNLALTMNFYNIAPFLCMSIETVADMANATMLGRFVVPPHPLKS